MNENQRSAAKAYMTTHGMSYLPEYNAWRGMKSRCNNPRDPAYKNYGGRGIRVCLEWENSPETFVKDMGAKPTTKHTLERVGNDKGYSPDNCIWALRSVQNRNHRRVRFLTFRGTRLCITDWAAKLGISRDTLSARIRLGWSVKNALTIPVGVQPIPGQPMRNRTD